jgi:hypothetical protein
VFLRPKTLSLREQAPKGNVRSSRGDLKRAQGPELLKDSVIQALTARVSVTAGTQYRGIDKGVRTTAVDVLLEALATAQADGYGLDPQRAKIAAWWGFA